MRLVILESPYAGDAMVVERNIAYARAAMHDCLLRGEAPFASHLLYTQPGVLNDVLPVERRLGIKAGLEWGRAADATVVYTDLGETPGMIEGVGRANICGRTVEYRQLPEWLVPGLEVRLAAAESSLVIACMSNDRAYTDGTVDQINMRIEGLRRQLSEALVVAPAE